MKKYELTPAQKNFALLQNFYKGTSVGTLCGIIFFDDLLERPFLIDAIKTIIKKHDALHLRFQSDNGKLMQYVADESSETDDNVCFMTFEDEDAAREYALKEGRMVFSADDAPMYRFTVFEIPHHTGIVLSASHIVLDSWSYSVLANDIYETYCRIKSASDVSNSGADNRSVNEHACFSGGVSDKSGENNEESVPERKYEFTSSFKRYESYLCSDRYKTDLKFWKERYEGGIEPTYIVPGRKNDMDSSSERRLYYLSPELSAKIKKFCTENSVSAAAVFESSVLIYLSRINRIKKVSINTMVLGRNNAAEKKTVGMYASVLPLTVSVKRNDSAAEICDNVMRSHREIYRRRDLPFIEIMSAVRSSGGISGKLTDVMVNFQNSVTEVPARTEWLSNGYNESAFVLNIDERDGENRYVFSIDYQTGVFESEKSVSLLTERIIHILTQITEHPEIRANEISLIPDAEREMLVYEFNDTDAELRNVSCVHEKISGLARKYPDRCALVFHGRKYTASELERLSDVLAGELLERDIGKGDIAALMCRRSPYMIIAMLAVMKTGAAYLPVSPDQPEERLKYMLEDAGAKLVLTFGCEFSTGTSLKLEDLVSEENLEKSGFRDNGMGDSEKTDNVIKDRINIHCSPDDPCYMIFTSGSSGRPKGTVITHRNVINYSEVTEHGICGGIIKNEKSIVSVTDHVFDIFVTESLMALLDLKTIILADDNEAKSGKALGRLVRNTHSEVIQTTPTKMRSFMLDKNALEFLSCFKKIILGGEELPASLIKELKKHTDAKIFNVYGPAETTVWSSFTEADENDITIGKPITNTKIYILDENRELLPSGIMGEICISGYGVGNGYPADPALTAEKFIPDKFRKGRMMYCTGDMGIMRADGNIVFCGRRDSQIKLRGLRIDLTETEGVMCMFAGINEAAVVCREIKGVQKLFGYYTSSDEVDETALRHYLAGELPAYMIPNGFMRLDSIPLTQSGKTDRKALPEFNIKDDIIKRSSVPENETEADLCRIMADVLKLESVGAEDDFFELGGDSFLALEFIAKAENEGYVIPLSCIYDNPTARGLSEENLQDKECKKTMIRQKRKYSRYPLERRYRDYLFFDAFVKLTGHMYHFEVTGLEKIDPFEKYIICPNHESDLDCMWVWAALSECYSIDDMCALIAAEHLDDPLEKFIFRVSGGIPVDRKGDFSGALRRTAYLIEKKKKLLLIHPEGTRTRSGNLGEYKKGAALISKNTGVKTVPVRIIGSGRIYPVTNRLPRLFDIENIEKYDLKIIFGDPIDPEGKSVEEITAEIRRQTEEM